MDQTIANSISDAVDRLIENTINTKKIKKLTNKHIHKIHFIPIKYRILGGILQSMNIQFGNFLENTIQNIVKHKNGNIIFEKYSGKKSNKFRLSKKTNLLIDEYINSCQTSNSTDKELENKYINLLKQIIINENSELETDIFTHDIDLLFKQEIDGKYIYVEIKYNDDHDTGKFTDINRKFLKTFAYLVRELNITDLSQIKPVLMYFNDKKMKGNIYLPEQLSIYRGKHFFDIYTNVNYDDLDNCFKNISENKILNEKFDNLYNHIMNNIAVPNKV